MFLERVVDMELRSCIMAVKCVTVYELLQRLKEPWDVYLTQTLSRGETVRTVRYILQINEDDIERKHQNHVRNIDRWDDKLSFNEELSLYVILYNLLLYNVLRRNMNVSKAEMVLMWRISHGTLFEWAFFRLEYVRTS